MNKKILLPVVIITAVFSTWLLSCKKQTDKTAFGSFDNYLNLKKGKFIIYKLDSAVTINFGDTFAIRSYLIKDSIADTFTDNLNRLSYKIYRYQYNAAGKTWNAVNTFYITPTDKSMEYVENNIRYFPLGNPLSANTSWRGNTNAPAEQFYPIETGGFNTWDFFYDNINEPFKVDSMTFPNTVTVVQYDSVNNKEFEKFNPGYFYAKGYEIYADTIGLIYKDLMSFQYQDNRTCILIKPKISGVGFDTSTINCRSRQSNCDSLKRQPNHTVTCDTSRNNGFYFQGYGIKMRIVSHN
jgi:hypothetical protein